MALSRKKYDEEIANLFPSMSFQGIDITNPEGPRPDPIPMDEFLEAVRKRFPGKRLKDLLIDFSDTALTVTLSTASARAKEDKLAAANERTMTSVPMSPDAFEATQMARKDMWYQRDDRTLSEWIGDLVEQKADSLIVSEVKPLQLEECVNFVNTLIPSPAYEKLRQKSRESGVSISAMISHILEAWLAVRGTTDPRLATHA